MFLEQSIGNIVFSGSSGNLIQSKFKYDYAVAVLFAWDDRVGFAWDDRVGFAWDDRVGFVWDDRVGFAWDDRVGFGRLCLFITYDRYMYMFVMRSLKLPAKRRRAGKKFFDSECVVCRE